MKKITFVVFGLLLIIVSFIFGYILQGFCIWIDGKNEYTYPEASILLLGFLKRIYWKFRIYILSILRRKEQIYLREMKKELQHGLLERNFFNALMTERNSKNIRPIIEVVFYSMEKNRRKKLLNQTFKFRNFFFIENLTIEYGYARGNNLVEYTELFVLYNRYLEGEYMPPNHAQKAAKLFGKAEEEIAASFESEVINKNIQYQNQLKEMKKRQQFRTYKRQIN